MQTNEVLGGADLESIIIFQILVISSVYSTDPKHWIVSGEPIPIPILSDYVPVSIVTMLTIVCLWTDEPPQIRSLLILCQCQLQLSVSKSILVGSNVWPNAGAITAITGTPCLSAFTV